MKQIFLFWGVFPHESPSLMTHWPLVRRVTVSLGQGREWQLAQGSPSTMDEASTASLSA